MPEIEIEKTGVLSLLEHIAKGLGGNFQSGTDEAVMHLNSVNGKGSIQAYELPGDISLLLYDMTFFNSVEYIFDEKEDRHLYFVYILTGYFEHRMGDQPVFSKLNTNQNIIVEVNPKKKNIIRLPKEVALKYIVINVANKPENPHLGRQAESLSQNLADAFSLKKEKKYYSYYGGYSLEALRLVENLYNIPHDGIIRRMVVNGLVLNILACQIAEHEANYSNPRSRAISNKEIEKMRKISAYIKSNLSSKHSVQSISLLVGLNSKRLQQCLKIKYGQTLIDFINTLKLEQAREWLLANELNISEITYRLGFSNGSYFTFLFKRKFGMTPLQYRKKFSITPSKIEQ